MGKPGSLYSFTIMNTRDEIERNITIHNKPCQFIAKDIMYNIIDCPGNPKFVWSIIWGAHTADAGILVVSAVEEEFLEGMSLENG